MGAEGKEGGQGVTHYRNPQERLNYGEGVSTFPFWISILENEHADRRKDVIGP